MRAIIFGTMGAGKDTLAGFLAGATGAPRTAQALPMKLFVKRVFRFSDDALWGPSEARNEQVERPRDLERHHAEQVCALVLGDRRAAMRALYAWFNTLPSTLVSARHVLQTLGTEWGRAQDRDMWARAAWTRTTPAGLIVTDGRFRSELEIARANGAIPIRVVNATPDPLDPGATTTHASEREQAEIPDSAFAYVVRNDKRLGLAALLAEANRIAADLRVA